MGEFSRKPSEQAWSEQSYAIEKADTDITVLTRTTMMISLSEEKNTECGSWDCKKRELLKPRALTMVCVGSSLVTVTWSESRAEGSKQCHGQMMADGLTGEQTSYDAQLGAVGHHPECVA